MDESIVSSCLGVPFLLFVAWSVWGLFRHRQARGPMDRGVKVWSGPMDDGFVEAMRDVEEQDGPWGWVRRDGDDVLVFSDPYSDIEHHMRLGTPWPYVVRLRLDEGTLEYRAPLGMLLLVGVPLLPVSWLLALINHAMQAGRIEDRLNALARSAQTPR